MIKLLRRLISPLAFLGMGFLVVAGIGQTFPPASAQIRGTSSDEFFGEGDQQTEQEIQNLQNNPSPDPSLQLEEGDLEQDLNIQEKAPNAPKRQEIPSPREGDGDNVPTPPSLGETQFKIP